jgi:SAM-dependent methyltransferase
VSWRLASDEPTTPEALAARAAVLDPARRHDRRTREELILDTCAGKRVLDIGCVDHAAAQVGGERWLHGRVASVASSCVGLDLHHEGVERMRELGYDAEVVDITEPPPARLVDDPFDVVVAGELIEHLTAPIALFEFAARVLVPGGTLVLTTPNPFAPWRARAGQLGIVWENADHLVYVFPSGVAEMAGRTGFRLVHLSTEGQPDNTRSWLVSGRALAKAVARRVTGRLGDQPRANRLGVPLPRTYLGPFELALLQLRRRHGQCGERSIYVLVHEPATSAAARDGSGS